jgi:hypothetical protein
MTSEEVLEEVELVFPLIDGGTLKNQGEKGILLIKPILHALSRVSCPYWTSAEQWTDKQLFQTCLYALLGKLIMGDAVFQEGDFGEYAQCRFKLDPTTGIFVNGDSAREIMDNGQSVSTTHTIMSALVIILLISMGFLLFMQNYMGK